MMEENLRFFDEAKAEKLLFMLDPYYQVLHAKIAFSLLKTKLYKVNGPGKHGFWPLSRWDGIL